MLTTSPEQSPMRGSKKRKISAPEITVRKTSEKNEENRREITGKMESHSEAWEHAKNLEGKIKRLKERLKDMEDIKEIEEMLAQVHTHFSEFSKKSLAYENKLGSITEELDNRRKVAELKLARLNQRMVRLLEKLGQPVGEAFIKYKNFKPTIDTERSQRVAGLKNDSKKTIEYEDKEGQSRVNNTAERLLKGIGFDDALIVDKEESPMKHEETKPDIKVGGIDVIQPPENYSEGQLGDSEIGGVNTVAAGEAKAPEEKKIEPAFDADDYNKRWEQIQKSGAWDRVRDLEKNNADVWVKRTSGEWQKGKIVDIPGTRVVVEFVDTDGKKKGKAVRTEEFLKWQDEYENISKGSAHTPSEEKVGSHEAIPDSIQISAGGKTYKFGWHEQIVYTTAKGDKLDCIVLGKSKDENKPGLILKYLEKDPKKKGRVFAVGADSIAKRVDLRNREVGQAQTESKESHEEVFKKLHASAEMESERQEKKLKEAEKKKAEELSELLGQAGEWEEDETIFKREKVPTARAHGKTTWPDGSEIDTREESERKIRKVIGDAKEDLRDEMKNDYTEFKERHAKKKFEEEYAREADRISNEVNLNAQRAKYAAEQKLPQSEENKQEESAVLKGDEFIEKWFPKKNKDEVVKNTSTPSPDVYAARDERVQNQSPVVARERKTYKEVSEKKAIQMINEVAEAFEKSWGGLNMMVVEKQKTGWFKSKKVEREMTDEEKKAQLETWLDKVEQAFDSLDKRKDKTNLEKPVLAWHTAHTLIRKLGIELGHIGNEIQNAALDRAFATMDAEVEETRERLEEKQKKRNGGKLRAGIANWATRIALGTAGAAGLAAGAGTYMAGHESRPNSVAHTDIEEGRALSRLERENTKQSITIAGETQSTQTAEAEKPVVATPVSKVEVPNSVAPKKEQKAITPEKKNTQTKKVTKETTPHVESRSDERRNVRNFVKELGRMDTDPEYVLGTVRGLVPDHTLAAEIRKKMGLREKEKLPGLERVEISRNGEWVVGTLENGLEIPLTPELVVEKDREYWRLKSVDSTGENLSSKKETIKGDRVIAELRAMLQEVKQGYPNIFRGPSADVQQEKTVIDPEQKQVVLAVMQAEKKLREAEMESDGSKARREVEEVKKIIDEVKPELASISKEIVEEVKAEDLELPQDVFVRFGVKTSEDPEAGRLAQEWSRTDEALKAAEKAGDEAKVLKYKIEIKKILEEIKSKY
ncbi:MAG TPA: hypothetical protein PK295_01680 [Candidatus Magasanikbacteria bacterium]|nr:hypothetical protein [Candidatus Magasanikbacteria bacterium]